MRVNSTCCYKDDRMHNMHSLHALDELMENVNMWTKALPLNTDQDSWIYHSPNAMVAKNALNSSAMNIVVAH